MQNVRKTLALMMVLTAACTAPSLAAAEAGIDSTIENAAAERTSWASPDSVLGTTFVAPTSDRGGPAADAVEAIPTPSAMNLGAGGLAILAASRIARRIRLAA